MADLKRTIEILFEGTNNTGTAITAVGRGLDTLNYQIATVAQPFADLTTAIVKLDAVLASLAAAGLTYAYSESSKLQSAFTELKKVAGDNAEVLDVAKTNAKALSNAYGEAASEILNSTANYVQAGYNVDEAMQLAKTGMDLVIAGGVDASQSSEILIASLKGFQEPASEAGRLLDILNEVSNNYATDIEQLGVGMAALSPIASNMGLSMEETAGILTPVIEVFRSGDEAANALKTGLLKLIDDTAPVQEALESIGVSQTDSNGALRSGKDILLDVSKAFQTLDEDQKLFVTQQLVGIEQSARMVTVFDNLGKTTEITATAMNSAGSAAKEVAARLEDPEVAVNRLAQGFKNLASSIGDDFQEAGTGAINGITSILNSLEDAVDDGAFDPLLDALTDFLEGLEEDFKALAEKLPEALEGVDYSGFLDALGEIKAVMAGLFDGVDLDKPETLTAAIQKIVDTMESIARVSATIGEVFVTVGGHILSMIDWFNNLDDGTKSLLGTISGVGAALTAIAVPVGVVTSALSGLGSVITLVAGSPIIAGFAAMAAGLAGVAKGTEFVLDKTSEWIGKNEEAEASLQFAKEVDEDIAQIYEEANKVGPAFEEMGQSAYESNLAIANSLEDTGSSYDYIIEKGKEFGYLVEEKKTVNVDTEEAKEKIAGFYKITEEIRDGQKWRVMIPVDTTEVKKAKKEVEDAIPAVKRLEIETDLEIAKVKSQAEIAQSALKLKAEVDIAEIEAAAKVTVAVAENIFEMFANTGDTISSLVSMFGDDTTISQDNAIYRAISNEQEYRSALLAQQKELNDAQVAYLKAKTQRMKDNKESLITVNGDGLQPHLEYIMWEVFEAIQVRATQEGLDQLLLGAE